LTNYICVYDNSYYFLLIFYLNYYNLSLSDFIYFYFYLNISD